MRQSFATLNTAAAQYSATCFAGHALEKTVFAGSVSFFGLIRSFRHITFTLQYTVPLHQIDRYLAKFPLSIPYVIHFIVILSENNNN